jgi:hypothetical protein
MRYFALTALAGIIAWLFGTLHDIGLSIDLLMRAQGNRSQLALNFLMANQRLLYFGAAIGMVAAIFIQPGHRLPRQWLSWLIVAGLVCVATIAGNHLLSMPGVSGWRDFLPRSWWRPDLLAPAAAVALVAPLIIEMIDALAMVFATLRRPRLLAQSSDVDVDGAVDHEGIARAEAYLAEKRLKVAGGNGRTSAQWSLTPRD